MKLRELLTHHQDTLYVGDDGLFYHSDGDGPYGEGEGHLANTPHAFCWLFYLPVTEVKAALGEHFEKLPLEDMILDQLWGDGPFAMSAVQWVMVMPDLLTEDVHTVLTAYAVIRLRRQRHLCGDREVQLRHSERVATLLEK